MQFCTDTEAYFAKQDLNAQIEAGNYALDVVAGSPNLANFGLGASGQSLSYREVFSTNPKAVSKIYFKKAAIFQKAQVYLDVCQTDLLPIGTVAFNAEGVANPEVYYSHVGRPGVYRAYAVSQNEVVSWLVVFYSQKTPVIVFDIDGTLTVSDSENIKDILADFWKKIYRRDYIPKERSYSREVANYRWAQNFPIVYVSGRPHNIVEFGRKWLAEKEFPAGPIFHTTFLQEAAPTNNGVGTWKSKVFSWLSNAVKIEFEGAYGNAKTDMFAYENANIPKQKTWILGKYGGEKATIGLGDSFENHYQELLTK